MQISLYANASLSDTGDIASCYDFCIISNINSLNTTLKQKLINTFETLINETETAPLQIAGYLKLLVSSSLLKIFTFNPELEFDPILNNYYHINEALNPPLTTIDKMFDYGSFISSDMDIYSSFINLVNQLLVPLNAGMNIDLDVGVLSFYDVESGEIIV